MDKKEGYGAKSNCFVKAEFSPDSQYIHITDYHMEKCLKTIFLFIRFE